jgi:ABC-type nitrate/sulfonate/bicarbonate transport system permease component
LYVEASGISPVTLPAPSRVVEGMANNRGLLFDHAVVTLKEALIGMAVSIVLGVALALLLNAFGPARRALYPLLVGSQTVPIVVIAPLLVLWFGFELTPKIVVVTLYTFFPITVAFASGLAATDREALLLMRTLGAGRLTTLRLLQVPQALPYLFTGLRIAVTYAVVGAVFAEWSGAREGLGIYVLLMKNAFRTDLVFAAIFLIALLSLALFGLVALLEKLMVRWR